MWLRAVLWGLVDSKKLAGGVVSLWWGKESKVVSEDRYIFPAARRSSRANYLENGYNLGKQLKLPQTATLAIRAPEKSVHCFLRSLRAAVF